MLSHDQLRELNHRVQVATGRLGRARGLNPGDTARIAELRAEAATARIKAFAGRLLQDLPPLPRSHVREIADVLQSAA